jgi:hypothetical protein
MAARIGGPRDRDVEVQYPPTVVALMRGLGMPIHRLPLVTTPPETVFAQVGSNGRWVARSPDGSQAGIIAIIQGEDGVRRIAYLQQIGEEWTLITGREGQQAHGSTYDTRRVSFCARLDRHGEERDEIYLRRLLNGQIPERDPWSILNCVNRITDCWDRIRRAN